MKWKGLRQSVNIEDKTLEDVNIPNGAKVYVGGYGSGYKTFDRRKDPAAKEWDDRVRAGKKVARMGDNVPTPTPRPNNEKTHDNIVTPGKWTTKIK